MPFNEYCCTQLGGAYPAVHAKLNEASIRHDSRSVSALPIVPYLYWLSCLGIAQFNAVIIMARRKKKGVMYRSVIISGVNELRFAAHVHEPGHDA